MKKATIPLRSSKAQIIKDKDNLPKEEPQVKPSDAAPEVKPEVKDIKPEIPLEVFEVIKPTGAIKAIGCNGFNLLLKKKNRLALNSEQYKMLGDPLDKLESEVIKLLPGWLQDQVEKNGPLAGPIIEAATLAFVIWKLNELPKVKPELPKEEPQVKAPDAAPEVKPEVK